MRLKFSLYLIKCKWKEVDEIRIIVLEVREGSYNEEVMIKNLSVVVQLYS